jgi:hypothetical protein
MRGAAFALMLLACDGDGCHGGPSGPASTLCQGQIARIGDAASQSPAAICKACCIQEVPYVGTIENGVCVCRRGP